MFSYIKLSVFYIHYFEFLVFQQCPFVQGQTLKHYIGSFGVSLLAYSCFICSYIDFCASDVLVASVTCIFLIKDLFTYLSSRMIRGGGEGEKYQKLFSIHWFTDG